MADRDRGSDRDRGGDRDRGSDRAEHELDGTLGMAGRAPRVPKSDAAVVVIGLGRFGGQVAESLMRLGHEVLAIDHDMMVVQQWADQITHVVQADGTNEAALRQLGVPDFGRVVVGIGTELEASVLTVLSLAEVGVREIWAKAINKKHGKILTSVGAAHVIYPEVAIGDRVAHLIASKMLDFTELEQGYALAKTFLPTQVKSETGGTELAHRYGVTVVAVRQSDGRFGYVPPDATIAAGSTVVVAGTTAAVQRFASAT